MLIYNYLLKAGHVKTFKNLRCTNLKKQQNAVTLGDFMQPRCSRVWLFADGFVVEQCPRHDGAGEGEHRSNDHRHAEAISEGSTDRRVDRRVHLGTEGAGNLDRAKLRFLRIDGVHHSG